jgi:hypothetical protein
LGYDFVTTDDTVSESIPDSVKDFPQFDVQKAVWGNPLQITLRKDSFNEQG